MTPNDALDLTAEMRQVYRQHLQAALRECIPLAQEFEIGVSNKLMDALERMAEPMRYLIDDAFTPTENFIQSEEWPK